MMGRYFHRTTSTNAMFLDDIVSDDLRATADFAAFVDRVYRTICMSDGATYRLLKASIAECDEYRLTLALDDLIADQRIEKSGSLHITVFRQKTR
ncbi:MAG: hypothetical protein IPK58_22140 [Acidobacteria bacterium]|nr:hypothetical protein [Acidobacteriota bacterium]